MTGPIRPASLVWGLCLALGATGLALRLWAPGWPVVTGVTAALLALVAIRVVALARDWRQGRIPGTRLLLPAVILVEGLGLVLSGASRRTFQVRLASALVLEVLLLGLAARALWRAPTLPGTWPEDRVATALEGFLPPRLARLAALELVLLGSAIRFGLGGFRQAPPEGFSHYREAALRALLPALPLLIPADVLLARVLFRGLPPWAHWVLHGATVYGVLWLVGVYATLKARPHQLQPDRLALHLGALKSVAFPPSLLLAAAPLPDFDDDWARHAYLKGAQHLVAKGNHLLELRLAAPVRVRGLLGPGRPTDRLVVSMDDPEAFLAALAPCA